MRLRVRLALDRKARCVMPQGSPATIDPTLAVDRFEAARLLGVSPGTIDNLRKRGILPSFKLGSRRLFERSDLVHLIRSGKGVSK